MEQWAGQSTMPGERLRSHQVLRRDYRASLAVEEPGRQRSIENNKLQPAPPRWRERPRRAGLHEHVLYRTVSYMLVRDRTDTGDRVRLSRQRLGGGSFVRQGQ
jgi:hypothetical protein